MRCPKCDHEIEEERNFIKPCEHCGYNRLTKKYVQEFCRACNEGNPKGTHICIHCGFDNHSGEYTNNCVACGKPIILNKIDSCDECAEKVININHLFSSIYSLNNLLNDHLISRSQYKDKIIDMIDNDISNTLINSDIEFYLKSFKKLNSKKILEDDEYENISGLILSKYTIDINENLSKKAISRESTIRKPEPNNFKNMNDYNKSNNNANLNPNFKAEDTYRESTEITPKKPLLRAIPFLLLFGLTIFIIYQGQGVKLAEAGAKGIIAGIFGLFFYIIYLIIKNSSNKK